MRRFVGVSFILLVGVVVAVAIWPQPQTGIRDRALTDLRAGETGLAVVAFGTSLTSKNAWPDRLAAELQACVAQPVRMVRVAKSGEGTDWALQNADTVVAAKPDLILMEFAINDADILDGMSLRRSLEYHDRLITGLRAQLPEAGLILMTMNPPTGLRRVTRPFLASYYAAYADLAQKHDVGLADLYPRWQEKVRQGSWSADGLHPTDEAANAIILPVLRAQIAAALDLPCP